MRLTQSAVLLSALALGSQAFALNNGPYFSANLGTMNTSSSNVNSQNSSAYQFAVGYQYALDPAFALTGEVGLLSGQDNLMLKTQNGSPTTVQMNIENSLDALVGLNYNFKNVLFSGKIGLVQEQVNFAPLDYAISGKTEAVAAGALGVAYLFNPHVSLGVNYFRSFGDSVSLDANNTVSGVPSINFYSVGLSAYF